MQNFNEWKKEFWNYKVIICLSVLFWVIANILMIIAGSYTEKKGDVAVSDLILNAIPTVDLSIIFAYGMTIIILVLILYPFFFNIKELHRVLIHLSLLTLARSIFITLTHLKQPSDAIITTLPRIYELIVFRNSLFFSGHVGFSFLGFLLYREKSKFLKYFFLIATLVMIATVLLMHVHYSIDVFAALFITYGVYKIGENLLRRVN